VDSRVGTAFGKYTVTRLIGKGGMGEVFEAYDTTKGRTVALKILAAQLSTDETFRARFQRESQAAAILQEPHVIPIHDWGEIDGNLYIDMRLVKGRTLADMLDDGPLAPSRAVTIIRQVAAALDAAHGEGLIHRDIKPQNIIVTDDDFAYLVDFGIAETKGDPRLTATGVQIGTLSYMAPERFSGHKVTAEVDVYALTCVLFEALTGELPFPGDTVEHQMASHVATPPPRPTLVNRRVPDGFDAVVARGMAKDPDDRYGSAGGLGRAAQRALDAGTGATGTATSPTTAEWTLTGETSTPPSAPAGSTSRPRRGWVMPAAVAAAILLVLAGIGVIISLLMQNARTEDSSGASSTATTSADGRVPPLVTGEDPSQLHQTCDQGFALPGVTGFGSRGGRGSFQTSCFLANSVLTAYWAQYGNASPLPRPVSAPGTVDCTEVAGAECDGTDFAMQCQQFNGDNWITCTGGTNARVYLW
jgi:serine/threonine protein kinase